MTEHNVYVCYRYTGEDDEAFVVFCETCMAGSPDFAIKKPATKLCKAHAADPAANPVDAAPMHRGVRRTPKETAYE